MISTQKKTPAGRLLTAFLSLKTALLLILLIILLSAVGTLFPSGSGWYKSALYLFPWILFFLNLSGCTLKRLLSHRRRRIPWGPDMIHLGLIVLLISGFAGSLLPREYYFEVKPGDQFELPDGRAYRIEGLEELLWENGAPRQWQMTLQDVKETRQEALILRVNQPLFIEGYRLYLMNYLSDEAPPRAGLLLVKSPPPWGILAGMILLTMGMLITLIEKSRRPTHE